MQTNSEGSIQLPKHLHLALESSCGSHRGLRGRNQHCVGVQPFHRSSWRPGQVGRDEAQHRSFCLGNWLDVTMFLFLFGDKVTVTVFTTELQVELRFTDHLSWTPILFCHWFTLRFVEKTILGNIAFDTSRSMTYHQKCNNFLSCWKIRWTRQSKTK